ncbi:MAG: SAM-dependent methyltransferase [Bacteroidales bacterium]|jgi:adenine-specific DNA-methyltransferase|nr:SAM-dependent methyltransferase [Bacteroidales bacterium]
MTNNIQYIDNTIESDYSKSVSLEHRKKFAQFFTPFSIAEIMVNWLLGNKNLKTVLEPAFGLGVFSRALLLQKKDIQIKGFEVDNLIFEKAKNEFACTEKMNLLLQDYMYNDWQNKYDGIICNPPYFKFHDYDNKNILKEIENHLQCNLSGFTNLYTLFLLKSIHQLATNGRCAYIIPSEFLNSDYGKLVKQHLINTGTLRHIIVFDFEENVFDDALTTACIVLCANDKKNEKVQFTNIHSISELNVIEKLIAEYPNFSDNSKTYSFSELNPDIKWKAYYQPQNGHKFKSLVPFSTYAKVVRGIATGANDYFTFNQSKAKEYNIDEKYLLPCICHCVDVKGNNFSTSDFEELKNNNKNVFLLNAINAKDDNITQYLQKGENEKINKKYLTASRNPWYSLENRPPAPIWVSVFNRTGLRFIRNEANISNLTTFHCIYPNQLQLFSDVNIDLLFAYLLTDTARQIFEDNSREYGNGLQKFEPNDINKGKMLDLALLPEKSKNKIVDLYYQFKISECNSTSRQVIDEIDNILIENYF